MNIIVHPIYKDYDYSYIGMKREQPIGWWFKKLLEPYGEKIITNPYIYDEYVRKEGKGCDILIPDLSIAIELKGLSKKLRNGKNQYVNKRWMKREVTGGELKEKGIIKRYDSRYPEGYNNKSVVFQWGCVCSQNVKEWADDSHDVEVLSPNVDLDHVWDNKEDLKKLKNFIYRNFVAPYKPILKKIRRLKSKWGDEWRLHYDLNSIRYKSDRVLSSICTRDNVISTTIHNTNIQDIDNSIVKDRYKMVKPRNWAEWTGETTQLQNEVNAPRRKYKSWTEYNKLIENAE